MKPMLRRLLATMLAMPFVCTVPILPSVSAASADGEISDAQSYNENGNVLIFTCGAQEVTVELCTARTARIQLSIAGADGYRPADPEYYMVQQNAWPLVDKTVTDNGDFISIRTDAIEIRVQKSPFRVGMYTLDGKLISKDADEQGMYWDNNGIRGVKKAESRENAGGIFGFGSGDHGRRANLNRYYNDFSEFTMSHGRVVAPFFHEHGRLRHLFKHHRDRYHLL